MSDSSSSEKPEFCLPRRLGSKAVCVAAAVKVSKLSRGGREGLVFCWHAPCCVGSESRSSIGPSWKQLIASGSYHQDARVYLEGGDRSGSRALAGGRGEAFTGAVGEDL